jgi:hypothetical protein
LWLSRKCKNKKNAPNNIWRVFLLRPPQNLKYAQKISKTKSLLKRFRSDFKNFQFETNSNFKEIYV